MVTISSEGYCGMPCRGRDGQSVLACLLPKRASVPVAIGRSTGRAIGHPRNLSSRKAKMEDLRSGASCAARKRSDFTLFRLMRRRGASRCAPKAIPAGDLRVPIFINPDESKSVVTLRQHA